MQWWKKCLDNSQSFHPFLANFTASLFHISYALPTGGLINRPTQWNIRPRVYRRHRSESESIETRFTQSKIRFIKRIFLSIFFYFLSFFSLFWHVSTQRCVFIFTCIRYFLDRIRSHFDFFASLKVSSTLPWNLRWCRWQPDKIYLFSRLFISFFFSTHDFHASSPCFRRSHSINRRSSSSFRLRHWNWKKLQIQAWVHFFLTNFANMTWHDKNGL